MSNRLNEHLKSGNNPVQQTGYELKSCPKCKSKGKVYQIAAGGVDQAKVEYQVGCTNCNFITPKGLLLVAIDYWNNYNYIQQIQSLEKSLNKASRVCVFFKEYVAASSRKDKAHALKEAKKHLEDYFN